MNTYYKIQRLGITFLVLFAIACHTNRGNSINRQLSLNDTIVFVGCQEKISIAIGSIVEVRLEAILGTGYQWLLKEQSTLIELLQPEELKYWNPDKTEVMPGQKSFQVLLFKTVKKGEGLIEFEYKRTFEAGIENNCQIKIVVQ